MRILGIIAEYDPFHLGHARHLRLAREAVRPDYTYAVLSGCFKQRGEPALLSPYDRAACALAAGADRVVELVCGQPVVLCDRGEVCFEAAILCGSGSYRQNCLRGSDEGISAQKRFGMSGSTETVTGKEAGMIFVTGPLYAGKQAYIMQALGWTEADFAVYGVRDVQDLAAEAVREGEPLTELADRLAEKKVVIATEVGGGVVPMDPVQRREREAAGRLSCLLAERARRVIRVCCGLPQVLK